MVKVKVFVSHLPSQLQNQVNKWLIEQQNLHEIYIINTTQTESEYVASFEGYVREITYTIIYKED